MPVHRVPVSEVEAFVADLEQRERIVSTEVVGDGAVLIFTEPKDQRRAPGEQETR
jgi:hypothetical protein